jgi:DNA-binding MarR family transcriptional regulator|tara:strand:+ start:369 stop:791 length:423 start_codon:yes stop_codon:yes gene_type:complete
MNIPDLSQNLKTLLFKRFEWYEQTLLASLEAQGDVSLTMAQSRALAVLNGQSSSISELARSLNISRQAAHKTVSRLVELDWIKLEDGDKGNEKVINFTEHGQQMRATIKEHMIKIEKDIAANIGQQEYNSLVRILTTDWQ